MGNAWSAADVDEQVRKYITEAHLANVTVWHNWARREERRAQLFVEVPCVAILTFFLGLPHTHTHPGIHV